MPSVLRWCGLTTRRSWVPWVERGFHVLPLSTWVSSRCSGGSHNHKHASGLISGPCRRPQTLMRTWTWSCCSSEQISLYDHCVCLAKKGPSNLSMLCFWIIPAVHTGKRKVSVTLWKRLAYKSCDPRTSSMAVDLHFVYQSCSPSTPLCPTPCLCHSLNTQSRWYPDVTVMSL